MFLSAFDTHVYPTILSFRLIAKRRYLKRFCIVWGNINSTAAELVASTAYLGIEIVMVDVSKYQ